MPERARDEGPQSSSSVRPGVGEGQRSGAHEPGPGLPPAPPLAVGDEALHTLLQHMSFQFYGLTEHQKLMQESLMRLEAAHEVSLERLQNSICTFLDQQCSRFESSFGQQASKLAGPMSCKSPEGSDWPTSKAVAQVEEAKHEANHKAVGSRQRVDFAGDAQSEATLTLPSVTVGISSYGNASEASPICASTESAGILPIVKRQAHIRRSGLMHAHLCRPKHNCFGMPVDVVPPSKILDVVNSCWFASVSATLVVLNALFIGYHTDAQISKALENPPGEEPEILRAINRAFDFFLCLEWCFRVAAFRASFFFGRERSWNTFDTALVLTSMADEFISGTTGGNFLRVMRVWRIVRVVRIFRALRFFRELRLLMSCIMSSFFALAWAILVVGLLIFVFAVLILQYLSYSLHNMSAGDDTRMLLSARYKSLSEAMFSLLMAISGGMEWAKVLMPLERITWTARPFFCLYVTLITFGVGNILTGVFVRKVEDLRRNDRDLAIHSEMADADAFVEQMRWIFEDNGYSGSTMRLQDLEMFMELDDVWAYMKTHNLDTYDTIELFRRLDPQESGKVNLEEFVFACQRLKGHAKSSDILTLLERSSTMERWLQSLLDQTKTSQRVYSQTAASIQAQLNDLHVIMHEQRDSTVEARKVDG